MIPRTTLRAALSDPSLLGSTLIGDSWRPWRTLLIAAMGEALDNAERAIFQKFTQREREPGQPIEELEAVVGRRGGKSRAISVIASYIAGLCTHSSLVRGERGVLLIIAPDQRQALICLDYISANFEGSPILRQLIESRTQSTLRLSNNTDIEVRAADFRRLRGPTYIAVIADEVGFWFSDSSANPDAEILNSVRPGLATTRGPLLLISSPYARRGELWRTYNKHFGPHGDRLILVAQGTSREFNPTSVVDRAMERDPASASAEYMAQFRSDIESFVPFEVVRSCTVGLFERTPQPAVVYFAFVDPSGGSVDLMTLAIAHFDHAKQIVALDCLREVKPPLSPEQTVENFCRTLRSYRCGTVTGDRYGGEWPREQFAKFNVRYLPAAKPKSDLYTDLLPLLNSRRIELLDNQRLLAQLVGLERRTARGGRDTIDHAPGAHDDLANCVAGVAALCVNQPSINYKAWNDDSSSEDPNDGWRRLRLQMYLESGGHDILGGGWVR